MAPLVQSSLQRALAWAPLVAVLALAVVLRLEDPLSTQAIPAEDPYTHMAYVREHLRDGSADPLNPGGGLYPPGLHVAVAAAVAFSGADLEPLMRFGPVLLGAVGVLGMAYLVGREAGPVAAFVASLAYAVLPEAIFRTTMMAPTALDLALLPFLLAAIVELVRGKLAWGVAVAVFVTFLLFSHPWLLAVLALAGAAFAVFALVLPWRTAPALDARGLAIAVLLVGVPAAVSLTGCSGWCGSFDFVVEETSGPDLKVLAPYAVIAALFTAGLLGVTSKPLSRWLQGPRPEPRPGPSLGLAILALAGVATLVAVAARGGFPEFVDFPRMLGWPVIVLAAIGLFAWPYQRTALAHVGAALTLTTLPFVVFNPFDSPFWPHRTAVYLGVGAAILCGVAAVQLVAWVRDVAAALPAVRARTGAAALAMGLAVLLVAVPSAGALLAATPGPDEHPWYRLFTPCQDDVLRDVADAAAADPALLVIAGSWQAKLVVAAHAPDAQRIWFSQEFFTDNATRSKMLEGDRPVLAVTDPYLRSNAPNANLSFLQQSPWSAGPACDGTDAGGTTTTLPDSSDLSIATFATPR